MFIEDDTLCRIAAADTPRRTKAKLLLRFVEGTRGALGISLAFFPLGGTFLDERFHLGRIPQSFVFRRVRLLAE